MLEERTHGATLVLDVLVEVESQMSAGPDSVLRPERSIESHPVFTFCVSFHDLLPRLIVLVLAIYSTLAISQAE